MVKFENALDVRAMDDGVHWVVLEDFYYDTDVELPDRRIGVSAHFMTDFASIPRIVWPIIGGPADGKYRKIAVVHDQLYRTDGLSTRAQADAVFLEGMKFSGCAWWQRTAMYLAVRLNGWRTWREYRKATV